MTIVIFGGGGDLAHRKLLPALYNLHVDGLLPPKIAIVGVGRKPMPDEAYRDFAKDGVTHFSRRPIDEAAWRTFAESLFFVAAEIDGEQGLAPLGARLDIIEHERGLTKRARLLSGAAVGAVRADRQAAAAVAIRRARRRPRGAARRRKADRHRSEERLRDQRRDRRGVRRAADLPHRSLPGQGDGPEHPGDALREQHLRAAVQPEVRRSRADHRRGGRRRRHPRRLLRAGGRAARHGAEPHAAAPLAGRDGAAALAQRRRGSRREARDPPVAAPAPGRRDRRQRGAGAVRRLRRRKRRQPALAHRDLRRAAGLRRQLALVRRPLFPADRQTPAEALQRDLDSPEGHPADSLQRGSGEAARAEHPGDPHPAGRRLLARHQLQASRPARRRSLR